MNGNISYKSEGPFKTVNNIGVKKDVCEFCKKFASSIKFIIITKIKKTPEIDKIFFKNFFKR